jgi:hypothetical protein
VNIIKEIVDNAGNGDIIDIEFISFNKKKKKVKRAFELG